jgi:hypothetical protein
VRTPDEASISNTENRSTGMRADLSALPLAKLRLGPARDWAGYGSASPAPRRFAPSAGPQDSTGCAPTPHSRGPDVTAVEAARQVDALLE